MEVHFGFCVAVWVPEWFFCVVFFLSFVVFLVCVFVFVCLFLLFLLLSVVSGVCVCFRSWWISFFIWY